MLLGIIYWLAKIVTVQLFFRDCSLVYIVNSELSKSNTIAEVTGETNATNTNSPQGRVELQSLTQSFIGYCPTQQVMGLIQFGIITLSLQSMTSTTICIKSLKY